jgi:hypothetical protein
MYRLELLTIYIMTTLGVASSNVPLYIICSESDYTQIHEKIKLYSFEVSPTCCRVHIPLISCA